MGIAHLWDSNTAIYFLQKQLPPNAEQFIKSLLITEKAAFSAITEIELLSWPSATPADVVMMEQFIDDALVFELEKPVKRKAADLRKGNRIKLPDAVIAATALVYNLTLLTRNLADFKNIQGLKLVNPWDQ